MREVAHRHHATAAPVALAWPLAQGDRVFAIPGTKKERYLLDNVGAGGLTLTETDLADPDVLPAATGSRY